MTLYKEIKNGIKMNANKDEGSRIRKIYFKMEMRRHTGKEGGGGTGGKTVG